MSLRGTKRATGVRGDEAGSSKRRRTEPEDALWQLRPVSDLKMSSIYNRSASEAPAELFRKDLISAMKLPDSEPLTSSEYWIITDTWKQDWERGVQVPVNPDSLPAPKVKIIENPLPPDFQAFKLPKDKYIHLTRDAHYQADKHLLSSTPARAEAACSYDLDATDTAWLKLLNAERARAGAPSVSEDQLEKVIEELEVRTWDKIQAIMKSEEGLGIEYDENVICDVCRSPDSEDGNEMVFCDSCNICVHQACYGITVIPDGQWLCRPCGAGVRPTCVLCPNLGGAMKCTPSGHKWAHVSCVLWIPEVSIGCAEKMEPITKITSIPPSRWSLVCILCRERKGACIQCSVKTCKTAYHVTCAFKHGLEMRAIIEDENADDGVKLRSYCQKHSVNSKKEKCAGSGSEEEEVKRKRRKDMTSEEKSQARAARLSEIEAEFDRHVSVKDISTHLLDVDQEAINYIYNYWKLKRRAGHNRPLLPPKSDDNELLTHRQEQADLDKMKMFVQLRQDLERVRNLCYMVSRREKLSRSFFRMREQTFHKQVAVLSCDTSISGLDLAAIIEANHGPSIYDRLYSHPDAPDHKNDFDDLLARIAPQEFSDDKKKDRNGLVRGCRSANPYKKHYVNGSRRSGSMYSGLSSEESGAEISRTSKYRGRTIGSSTDDDDVKKSTTSPKKKVSPKGRAKKSPTKIDRKKKKVPQSKPLVESSSEEEIFKQKIKKDRTRSKTLQQMEKEMAAGKTGQSGTDSDDLIPIRSTRNKFTVDIYTDSSETSEKATSDKSRLDKVKTEKSKIEKSPHENDSQQSLPRTKAAMKEFIPTQPEKKTSVTEEKPAPKKRGRKPSNRDKKPLPNKPKEVDEVAKNKENIKFAKKKDPTDLIVPQRQAAKKASENMRSTTTTKKEEPEKQVSSDDAKNKPKIKGKGKEIKESPEKIIKKKVSKEIEKEPIAYVPQRQAAKKAAAHIKSGLGSKIPAGESAEVDKKKEIEKSDILKTSPKKEDIKSKSPQKESSSSSSNTSSSSYSSSSSSEEEPEKPSIKPTAKAREIKPAPRPLSMFSPPGTRPTVDLPFLDKVSRPLSSTSASSDSDSSKGSRSGSGSPSPKRPRRRRKGKSLSSDASPRKAPDKKLKTSERAPEPGVSSSPVEGEESTRSNDTRAATRARTRSTTSSGNMLNKFDTRQRKPSRDESGSTSTQIKTSKESSKSAELTVAKRKTDEEINNESKKEVIDLETTKIEEKTMTKSVTSKGRSKSIEDKEKARCKDIDNNSTTRISPRKSTELKQKTVSNRRMSTREATEKKTSSPAKDLRDPIPIRERRQSRRDSQIPETKTLSPTVKGASAPDKDITTPLDMLEDRMQSGITEDFNDADKSWLPKASSPKLQPPPVEKPGDHEKYMTEDKCLDSDFADKSSLKMIAKIQANLNENTMIKSPKTPMDARTMDPMDVENPIARNIRKRSLIDPDKKFITQDASNVQAVEISKSAKIPSTVNPFPNRPMFSPQSKENELFEFDILAVEDSFNHDEMLKPFPSYPEFFFKEDSKEQGVQETFNLVDRLRVQLINKKAPADTPASDDVNINADKTSLENERIGSQSDQDNSDDKKSFEPEPVKDSQPLTKQDITGKSVNDPSNVLEHDNSVESKDKMQLSQDHGGKWIEISGPPTAHEVHSVSGSLNEEKYDTMSYTEDVKEPKTVLSMNSVSEIGDTISLSKQSDDSQSLSVVDNSIISNEQDLTQDNQTYDNNNSVIHSDCATISSPYVSSDSKWRESKITTRRSSASSTNSDVSLCSQKTETKSHIETETRRGPILPEIDPYPPMPAYSCRVEPPMSLNQYTSCPPDASPFLNPISSLPFFTPGACASSQLPLPSPGPSIYGSGLPFTTPLMQPLPKPSFPLCAAFTSSSQNIALTTAMIASPTPKIMDSPRDDIDVTGSDKMSIHVVSSPSIDSFNDSSNTRAPTKMSSDSSEAVLIIHPQDSKSPAKPTKPVTKFPGKSPGKSPGISPKQSDLPKGTKRSNNRSNRSQRGRGRSKSRGQAMHNYSNVDYVSNSITSKLVGTVYDFEEEIANDGVGIKALRERRKSVDVKDDRKSENSYKDSSQSPRTISPQPINKRSTAELKQEKLNSPENLDSSDSTANKNSSDRGAGLQPVLPGPVDMRTYNPFDNPAPVANDAYNSHLLAFASGTADQQLIDIDEDAEKQLHSALMASNPRPGSPTAHGKQETIEPAKEIFTPQLPKVSLSDSRNQLKVKIKGPFLDANYSTSSVQPVAPQPPAPIHEPTANILNASCSSANTMSGSTNLRRMRKKELLRQYWTQDMNMDDPGNTSTVGSIPPPAAPQPLARAVITIPKAVASMTSIPTREDYKICDTPIEKKKRKTTSGLSRELRHLEVRMNDETDPAEEVKLPTFTATSSQAHKRRGRVNTKPSRSSATSPVAPKLKIKFGSNVFPSINEDTTTCSTKKSFRPPKKRLQTVPAPRFDVIKRESMKFRRMVMADFEDEEESGNESGKKTSKHKPDKSEKKKKKKDKKTEKEKLQVINSESESATRLVIKIKRTKDEDGKEVSGEGAAAIDPFDYDPTARDPLAIDPPFSSDNSSLRKVRTDKVTPIRLKIARSSQGSGYVMKEAETGNLQVEGTSAAATATSTPSASSLPVTVNKHCEVR